MPEKIATVETYLRRRIFDDAVACSLAIHTDGCTSDNSSSQL